MERQEHGGSTALTSVLAELRHRQLEEDYLQARLPSDHARIRRTLQLALVLLTLSAGFDFVLLPEPGDALRLLVWRLCLFAAVGVALLTLRGDVTRRRLEWTFIVAWSLLSLGLSVVVWSYALTGEVIHIQAYMVAMVGAMAVARLRIGIVAAALTASAAVVSTALHPNLELRTQLVPLLCTGAVVWGLTHWIVADIERRHRLQFVDRAQLLLRIDELEQGVRSLREQVVYNQKARALGVMTAGLVHDFNNMMTVVRANAVIAKDALAARLPPAEVEECLHDILMAVQRASEITKKLMAFNRPEASTAEAFVFDAVIDDITLLLRRLIPKQIEFTVTKGAGKTRVILDKTHLEQVVSNLVVNSMEAIAGTGRIALSTDYDPGRSEVVLVVEDNGEGISDDLRRKVFEPFYTTKATGSGLGLSTIKSVVEEAGGCIAVDGVKAGGTKITIRLPLISGIEESSSIRASRDAPGERISEVTSSRSGRRSLWR